MSVHQAIPASKASMKLQRWSVYPNYTLGRCHDLYIVTTAILYPSIGLDCNVCWHFLAATYLVIFIVKPGPLLRWKTAHQEFRKQYCLEDVSFSIKLLSNAWRGEKGPSASSLASSVGSCASIAQVNRAEMIFDDKDWVMLFDFPGADTRTRASARCLGETETRFVIVVLVYCFRKKPCERNRSMQIHANLTLLLGESWAEGMTLKTEVKRSEADRFILCEAI